MTAPLAACAALMVSTACGRVAEADVPAASNTSGDVVFETASPKFAYVDVETVRVSNERTIAMMPAQVVLDEDHTVRVYSPVSGRIRELLVRPGDVVTKGAPLARIVSADFAQATSDLVKAQSASAQASAARTRAEDLFVHHVIALRDLEQARNDALQARGVRQRSSRQRRRAQTFCSPQCMTSAKALLAQPWHMPMRAAYGLPTLFKHAEYGNAHR